MYSRAGLRDGAEDLGGVLDDPLSVRGGSQMDDALPPDPSLVKLWVKSWMEKGAARADWVCSPRTSGQPRQHGAVDTGMRTKRTLAGDGRLRRRWRCSCGDIHAGSDSRARSEMTPAHWWTGCEGWLSAWVCAGLVPPLHGPVESR